MTTLSEIETLQHTALSNIKTCTELESVLRSELKLVLDLSKELNKERGTSMALSKRILKESFNNNDINTNKPNLESLMLTKNNRKIILNLERRLYKERQLILKIENEIMDETESIISGDVSVGTLDNKKIVSLDFELLERILDEKRENIPSLGAIMGKYPDRFEVVNGDEGDNINYKENIKA